MKHVRAITYKPKINAVLSGECKQTIRPGWKIKPADHILFHGWEGKPYHSKWSWRKKVFKGMYRSERGDKPFQIITFSAGVPKIKTPMKNWLINAPDAPNHRA